MSRPARPQIWWALDEMRRLLAPPAETVTSGDVPSFSIVIAAYQVADVIGEAIESVLAQTVPPLEIVVCDDGSTDDLEAALAPYRDRIVFVRKTNGGEASAKNAAARAAAGDFVAILDADDVYMPERLQALGELAAARPDLDILTTDAFLELDGRRVRRVYEGDWTFEVADQRRAILQRNFVFGLAPVRRERLLAARGFDEGIRWTTDWDCWARLILGRAAAGAVAEPLALYRLRQSSLSADRAKLVAGRVQTLEKAASHPSLTPAERRVVAASIATERRELALLERSLRANRRRTLLAEAEAAVHEGASRAAQDAGPRGSSRPSTRNAGEGPRGSPLSRGGAKTPRGARSRDRPLAARATDS